MRSEYLLFNIIVLIGPLTQSFDRRVRFVRRWRKAFIAALLSAIPFIIWDIAVTGRHWYFNDQFVLGLRLLGLPIEEWLFFITVPFACLFIWEIILKFLPRRKFRMRLGFRALLFGLAGIVFFIGGFEYTGLVFIAIVVVYFLNGAIKSKIWDDARLLALIAAVLVLTLIFNGYLTARPVVLYNPQYLSGERIFTIPLEDFIFGLSHILLTVMIYERLKGNYYGKKRGSSRGGIGRTGRSDLAGESGAASYPA